MTAFSSLNLTTSDIVAGRTIEADSMVTRFDDIETVINANNDLAANISDVNTFAAQQTFNAGIQLKTDDSQYISHVKDPDLAQDAATKNYADGLVALGLTKLGAGWTQPVTNDYRPVIVSGSVQTTSSGYAYAAGLTQLSLAGKLGGFSSGVFQVKMCISLVGTGLNDTNWQSFAFSPTSGSANGRSPNPERYNQPQGNSFLFVRGKYGPYFSTEMVDIITDSNMKFYINNEHYNATHVADMWVFSYVKLS